jgi:hypothetical protein
MVVRLIKGASKPFIALRDEVFESELVSESVSMCGGRSRAWRVDYDEKKDQPQWEIGRAFLLSRASTRNSGAASCPSRTSVPAQMERSSLRSSYLNENSGKSVASSGVWPVTS